MVISMASRREIIDFILLSEESFYGKFGLISFLNRVWNLSKMKSTDRRFINAEEDIEQHMITYDDWTERYLLYDYLNILEISDEIFLSFIENCLHPLVTSDDKKVNRLVNFFNTVLAAEEYQLEVVALRTGRPVYRSMKYKPNLQNTLKDPAYEVVLSYAGEDREYVELVADFLRKNNVKVFYDKFEEVAVWGKDLSELLANVYGGDAQYCVMFISKSYAEKAWTTHEKRNAMAKAVNEKTEYILPVRFDNTDLPGLVPSIAYVDLKKKTSNELGKMILQKLGKLTR